MRVTCRPLRVRRLRALLGVFGRRYRYDTEDAFRSLVCRIGNTVVTRDSHGFVSANFRAVED
jgi:hypothetical protein